MHILDRFIIPVYSILQGKYGNPVNLFTFILRTVSEIQNLTIRVLARYLLTNVKKLMIHIRSRLPLTYFQIL